MKLFDISLFQFAIRFYMLMAVVIILGVFDHFTLAAIFGFTLASGFILGISFNKPINQSMAKEKDIPFKKRLRHAA